MNTIISFALQMILTLLIVSIIVGYLRPFLKKILVDLCGTEDRAQFWLVFSNVILIGLPGMIALNYRPQVKSLEELFFEIAGQLSGALAGFLFALVCVGMVISVFALFAPRTAKLEAK
ncbi:MAG: hypothetical protein RIR73_1479 [Chloroflexota bacterium]|jgi:hypothetical protein